MRSESDGFRNLRQSYRAAWDGGDREDRYAALDFVRRARERHGFDLLIEGLRSDDPGLARHAASITLFLLSEGLPFDASVKTALTDFGERFPGDKVVSDSALRRLADV